MENLLTRKFFWLWVIVAMIFSSFVISLIFILINKCISRKAKNRIMQFPRPSSDFKVKGNQYQERNFNAKTPPLPPRTQFLTAEAQSYENLAEECVQNFSDYEQSIPDYVQDVHDYEQDVHDYEQSIPDYVQDVHDYEQDVHDYEQSIPDYEQSIPDYVQSIPDYEQDVHDYEQSIPDYVQSIPDYVQDVPDYEQDKLSDYVKVEDDDEPLPLPPRYQDADPAADNTSTEDYDDIGGEDGNEDDEDYDDLG